MHILTKLYRLPFVRNIAGAAFGMAVALVLYGVYGVGSRVVAALIPVDAPSEQNNDVNEEGARNAKLIETALRAKKIAEEVH
ncbi:hypothetical protein K8942_00130 [Candidatus Peribacteria bacterium]|nr:MAG: hypothetical protein K8942_00130 [Candidatus Peribacteria bacterium]